MRSGVSEGDSDHEHRPDEPRISQGDAAVEAPAARARRRLASRSAGPAFAKATAENLRQNPARRLEGSVAWRRRRASAEREPSAAAERSRDAASAGGGAPAP